MLKKLLVLIATLYVVAAFAAVDVNQASVAELDSIKGIGPGISGKIIEARKSGAFKDWGDFIGRVNGVGENAAARFSVQGLMVNGQSFSPSGARRTTTHKQPRPAPSRGPQEGH